MFSVRKAAQAARHAAEAVRAPALARMKSGGRVVLVEGQRTPFAMSGTIFKDLIAQDLGRMAIKGLLTKTALDPADVDYVTYGTVIQEGTSRRRCSSRPWAARPWRPARASRLL